MAYHDNPSSFQALKWIQLLFSFLVFILEMIELGATMNYDRNYGTIDQNPSLNLGKDWAKKYIYFVFGLTIFCLALYLAQFESIWKARRGPSLWVEISFLSLWFSASMTNLDDIFKNEFSSCANIRTFFSSQPMIPQEPLIACNTYIASLVFCWLITLTFILSTFISWKIRTEKPVKIQKTRKIKVMKYHDGNNKSEIKRATFIRVESRDESNNEFNKGVVEIKMDNEDLL
ncbi:hypothetical protein C1645_809027 [Glomus cerebriforme]|uniref:MARVEL domain-containing protein n=1 Tax=Glomus cerebriforme TaxID=658196 RepID=A0A397SMQ0_9GLOM|nr:hypothetical protein C1645_809027 [Glomus cerebriforme]